jgi:hypothetical protein
MQEPIWPDEVSETSLGKYLSPADVEDFARARRLLPEANSVKLSFFKTKSWE